MARDWKTTYVASAASAQHAVTYPSAAVAGHTLVAFAAAPATIALPAGWTEHADPLGNGELSGGQVAAAGGETQLVWDREAGQSTAPRSLAGWVESRGDLGALHAGTVQQYPTSSLSSAGDLELAPLVTSVDGCRIYVAVSLVAVTPPTWAPTWNGPVTAEDTLSADGFGEEAVRLSVASGVVPAGTHNISISGLPVGPQMQVVAFAVEPGEGDPPEPPPAAETAVEAENRLAGTAQATWDVAGAGDPSIQGFPRATHVDRGATLGVSVHSPTSAWTGTVYRLGYYGGLGAREVATITGPQTTQPSGTVDPTTGMASCANWSVNGTWAVGDAPAGTYIVKIARDDNPALASHIGPFVVRDPGRKAGITVKLSDSTWQAYNHAGADPSNPFAGKSIYGVGTAAAFTFDQGQRARAVSYDRPLVTRLHLPQTSFWNAEYPLVRWLERLGYDVDYLTCAQVDADPTLLAGRRVVISSGHDEYWSQGMWDAATGARDHATQSSHLLYLSGNEAFWRINWADGRRSYACWKDTHDGALNSTGVYSGTWQDTRAFNPLRRPVALLNGQRFRLNGISAYALAVPASMASSPLWRHTEVADLTSGQWTSPVGIVGFEADEPADTDPTETPDGLVRLSQVTHDVTGMLADDNGDTYTGSGPYVHAITAYRSSETGAAVFAAGTVQYAWGLDDVHDRHPGGTLATPVLQQALTNLLADLGSVPPAYPFPAALTMPTPVALSTYGLPDPEPEPEPEEPTDLVTMTEFESYLKAVNPQLAARVTGDLADAAELALAAAVGEVVDFCGWHIAPQRTDTVTVDGSGSPIQALPTMRLVDLVSVTEDGTAVDVSDVQWSEAGYLWRSTSWTRRLRGVVAEIEHGYATTPATIVSIVCAAAARGLSMVPGVARESSGGESISYTPGEGVPLTEQEQRVLARRYQIANPA